MFVDEFPAELYDKIVDWLESENSWCLIRDVEMSLDDEDANIYKSTSHKTNVSRHPTSQSKC